jgi:hypothetical protein
MGALLESTNPSTPFPAIGPKTTIYASAILTAAFKASSVINVQGYRKLDIIVRGTHGDAGNLVNIVPLLSDEDVAANADGKPLATDDVWDAPMVGDGSVVGGTLPGTLLSGADFTLVPNWGRISLYPVFIRLPTSSAATDKIRYRIPGVHLGGARWFHVQANDSKGSGTLSTISIAVRAYI